MQTLVLYILRRHNDITEIQRINTNPPDIKFDYTWTQFWSRFAGPSRHRGHRSYVTHLTRLFFKEPTWCEITLNGFEMTTGTISRTFSGTKLNEKSRSASRLFRRSHFSRPRPILHTYIASN